MTCTSINLIAECSVLAFSKRKGDNFSIFFDDKYQHFVSISAEKVSMLGVDFENNSSNSFTDSVDYLLTNTEFKFDSTLNGFELNVAKEGQIEINVNSFLDWKFKT